MRLRTIAGILLVGTLALQVALAATGPTSARREENRHYLLDDLGAGYDPTSSSRVRYGTNEQVREVTVTAAQAMEMQLDFYDRHNIHLSEMAADRAANPPAPAQNVVLPAGQYEFHEVGAKSANATCPTVEPQQEPTVNQIFNDQLHYGNFRLGILTTDMSKHNGPRGYESRLWYWTPEQDHLTATRYASYWYTGWTLKAGPFIDFICPPYDSAGKIYNDSYVQVHVTRTDPPLA
jgi:hypothetical protein